MCSLEKVGLTVAQGGVLYLFWTYDNDSLYEPDLHPEGEITNEEAADLMDVDPEPLDPRGGHHGFCREVRAS